MKSTGSETIIPVRSVNFTFMAESGETLPAGPMLKRLRARGDKAALCLKLSISQATLSNWLKRGVPKGRVAEVADALSMTTERYYFEAGRPLAGTGRKQGQLDTPMLVSDFEALPGGLRAVISNKARELRELLDSVPENLKPLFSSTPPTDPDSYRQWEASIEDALAALTKRKPDDPA